MAAEKVSGLSVDNYTLKGWVIDRTGDIPAGIAKHVASGIIGDHPKYDRTTPIEQRRDRYGRLHK